MNILIIGNGAREYSIGKRLKEDKNVKEIYFAPGNGGTENIGKNINFNNFEDLVLFAKEKSINLTIVGPEKYLTEGIVDIFKKHNLSIFGPSKKAARLEGSKAFMKDFLAKNSIKTAKYLSSNSYKDLSGFIDTFENQTVVVKADGLCGGKGVIIAKTHDEAKQSVKDMLNGESFGSAGKMVVVEEFLDGFELSFFAICDGDNFVSLPVAQDHKKLLDNDMGPNTGGMGAYAPSPLASKELIEKVEKDIIKPTLIGMKNDNNPFCGVLFVGLMIVKDEIYVLEYNVRFGDPECEVLMPLIGGNLSDILLDAANGKLSNITLKDEYAVGVVIASENYPYKETPKEAIKIGNCSNNAHISFGGVSKEENILYANGGRVLVCVGLGKTIKQAKENSYELCKSVKFKGMQYRKDISYQVLANDK